MPSWGTWLILWSFGASCRHYRYFSKFALEKTAKHSDSCTVWAVCYSSHVPLFQNCHGPSMHIGQSGSQGRYQRQISHFIQGSRTGSFLCCCGISRYGAYMGKSAKCKQLVSFKAKKLAFQDFFSFLQIFAALCRKSLMWSWRWRCQYLLQISFPTPSLGRRTLALLKCFAIVILRQ